jgi:hypothetical protein
MWRSRVMAQILLPPTGSATSRQRCRRTTTVRRLRRQRMWNQRKSTSHSRARSGFWPLTAVTPICASARVMSSRRPSMWRRVPTNQHDEVVGMPHDPPVRFASTHVLCVGSPSTSDQLRSRSAGPRFGTAAAARDDQASAAEVYARAVAQAPTCLPLLVEATDQLLAANRPTACLIMIDAVPEQTSKPQSPVGFSKMGSRCPIFGRGRRLRAQWRATGRSRTTTTSGCASRPRPVRWGMMTTWRDSRHV